MLQILHRLRSDESLMLAYQQGDSGAFESLYHRHKNGLFTFLLRSCQRHAIVEELAQETWMAVIRAAERYQPEAAFRTWLYQIAHNRLVDFWRRRENNQASLDDASPEATPVDSSESRDAVERDLMAAISQLPAEQRDSLLLQQQGFGVQEIAEITGDGTETVKSRLRYARKQLRVLLGENQ